MGLTRFRRGFAGDTILFRLGQKPFEDRPLAIGEVGRIRAAGHAAPPTQRESAEFGLGVVPLGCLLVRGQGDAGASTISEELRGIGPVLHARVPFPARL